METQNRQATTELSLVNDEVKAPALAPTPITPASPIDMVARLLERGVTPEQLDKFLDVQQKYEAEQARRAFERAMVGFKGEDLPEIRKKKRVHFNTKDRDGKQNGTVDYKHETLDDVVAAVVKALAKHGLRHKWVVDQQRAKPLIVVKCVIAHEQGHSEEVELLGLPDNSGRKNPVQEITSTITLLQRKTLLLATGLAAKGEDNDGRGSARANEDHVGDEPAPSPARGSKKAGSTAPKATANAGNGTINAAQLKLLRGKLKSHDVAEKDALARFGIETLEALPFARLNDALQWAERNVG